MRIKEDLSGKNFGQLTVLHRDMTKIGLERGSFWICNCICGKQTSTSRHSLVNHGTKSCGCLVIQKAMDKGLDGDGAHRNYWLSKYKKRAKRLCIDFTLSAKDFFDICEQNCYYCDATPTEKSSGYVKKSGKGFFYKANGIDRVDPQIGYVTGNCVACCKECNFMKTNKSIDNFLSLVKAIYNNRIATKETKCKR